MVIKKLRKFCIKRTVSDHWYGNELQHRCILKLPLYMYDGRTIQPQTAVIQV